MTFNKVISLGPSCETAWQIRQIVDQPEAYVFDWLIAPANCVAQAIREDFSQIVHPGQLSLRSIDSGDRSYVFDAATGIEYHHDFVNNSDYLLSLTNVQQKYKFLIDRMRRLLDSDAEILFVHQGGTLDEAMVLEDAIADRFPRLRFNLVEFAIGAGEKPLCQAGRIIVASTAGNGLSWQDRMLEWQTALDVILKGSFGSSLSRVDPALSGQR